MSDIAHRNINLFIAIATSAVLIILKNTYFTGISDVILLAIYLLFFCVLNKEQRVIYYFFLIPANIGNLLYFVHLSFFALILLDFLKLKVKKIPTSPFIIAVILLSAYEIMHELVALTTFDINILNLAGFIACLIILSHLLITHKDPRRIGPRLALSWSFGVIILAICMAIIQFNFGGFTSGDIRLGSPAAFQAFRDMGLLWQDPNYLGMYAVTGIVAMILLRKTISYNSGLIIAALVTIGLLTGSRGFLLSLGVFIALYILLGLMRFRISKIMSVALISCGVIILLTYLGVTEYLFEMFSGRMEAVDISNGRLDLYTMYIQTLIDNPLVLFFGVGLVSYPSKIGELSQSDLLMVHNPIIEIVAMWGIVGLFVALSVLILWLRNTMSPLRSVLEKTRTLLPITIFLISTLTITIFYSYHAIMMVLFIIVQETRMLSLHKTLAKERSQ